MEVVVNLKREVKPEELERALLNAAEELGWRAKVREETRKEYNLGSVQEVDEYTGTDIFMHGRVLPKLEIRYDKRFLGLQKFFFLNRDLVSKAKVREYLEAVSRNLG